MVGLAGFEPDLNRRHPVWAGVCLACSAGFGWAGFRWNQADSGFWAVWLIGLGLVHRYHLVTVLVACGRGGASACREGLDRIQHG